MPEKACREIADQKPQQQRVDGIGVGQGSERAPEDPLQNEHDPEHRGKKEEAAPRDQQAFSRLKKVITMI